jgi:hypothetical protein
VEHRFSGAAMILFEPRLYRLLKNSFLGALYQGTTSVVPHESLISVIPSGL